MRLAPITLALLLCAPVARAQTGAPQSLLEDWRRDKDNVLAYLEAMPESGLEYRPTPGVRTFAQQFDHIVGSNVDVAQALLGQAQAPQLGDSSRYLHGKAALRAYITAAYDYVLDAMTRATSEQWRRRFAMYGQPPELPARWLELAHEHSIWTLGQVVPYLRLNRITPPPYHMPF